MQSITLRGHFDGKQILLDDPFDLEPNAELIITVLPQPNDEERQGWSQLSMTNLARAYSDDEPEYSLDSIKEANLEYERR